MTKPTFFTWVTDSATRASSTDYAEPTSGLKAYGQPMGMKLIRPYWNWLLGRITDCLNWFDGFNLEAGHYGLTDAEGARGLHRKLVQSGATLLSEQALGTGVAVYHEVTSPLGGTGHGYKWYVQQWSDEGVHGRLLVTYNATWNPDGDPGAHWVQDNSDEPSWAVEYLHAGGFEEYRVVVAAGTSPWATWAGADGAQVVSFAVGGELNLGDGSAVVAGNFRPVTPIDCVRVLHSSCGVPESGFAGTYTGLGGWVSSASGEKIIFPIVLEASGSHTSGATLNKVDVWCAPGATGTVSAAVKVSNTLGSFDIGNSIGTGTSSGTSHQNVEVTVAPGGGLPTATAPDRVYWVEVTFGHAGQAVGGVALLYRRQEAIE